MLTIHLNEHNCVQIGMYVLAITLSRIGRMKWTYALHPNTIPKNEEIACRDSLIPDEAELYANLRKLLWHHFLDWAIEFVELLAKCAALYSFCILT